MSKNKKEKFSYFKSKAHEYVYCLLTFQGSSLGHKLGVNHQHYKNKPLSEKWKAEIISIIDTEFKEPTTETIAAKINLEDLFESIIEL